tara:strand:+ start:676 stop:1674 length:999 start_codon:yes stop_codon:yes gene_type:complete
LVKPFEKLKEKGHSVDMVEKYHESKIDSDKYDCLVFNRGLGYNYHDLEIIDKFKDKRIKIIMDIDDYWVLPDYHPIVWRKDVDYDAWKGSIVANLAMADYIWTSTEWLKSKIESLVPNTPTVIARNAIDYDDELQWSEVRGKSRNKDKVVIGYAGSTTHYKDLDALQTPIRRINSNSFLRKNVVFNLFGVDNKTDVGKKVWNHQAKVMTVQGRFNNLYLDGGRHVSEYAYFYDEMDVSIASVVDNEFNRCKSELKIIEAGAKYTPFIGTDIITYNRTDANIDLCGNPDEWVDSMKELILNKHLRAELGKELGEYVRDNYIIDKENQARLSIL